MEATLIKCYVKNFKNMNMIMLLRIQKQTHQYDGTPYLFINFYFIFECNIHLQGKLKVKTLDGNGDIIVVKVCFS